MNGGRQGKKSDQTEEERKSGLGTTVQSEEEDAACEFEPSGKVKKNR